MILVSEEGTTATRRRGSKTQVTRTATFFKEIPQLIPPGRLSSATQLVKKLFCNLKIPPVPLAGRLVHFRSSWGKIRNFVDSQGISNYIPLQTKTKRGTRRNKLFNASEGYNFRSGKSLEEGCCRTSLSTRRILSNIFIMKKRMGAKDM